MSEDALRRTNGGGLCPLQAAELIKQGRVDVVRHNVGKAEVQRLLRVDARAGAKQPRCSLTTHASSDKRRDLRGRDTERSLRRGERRGVVCEHNVAGGCE